MEEEPLSLYAALHNVNNARANQEAARDTLDEVLETELGLSLLTFYAVTAEVDDANLAQHVDRMLGGSTSGSTMRGYATDVAEALKGMWDTYAVGWNLHFGHDSIVKHSIISLHGGDAVGRYKQFMERIGLYDEKDVVLECTLERVSNIDYKTYPPDKYKVHRYVGGVGIPAIVGGALLGPVGAVIAATFISVLIYANNRSKAIDNGFHVRADEIETRTREITEGVTRYLLARKQHYETELATTG
jgi:hypothetical protein